MSNVIHILTGRAVDPETGTSPHRGECLACFLRRVVEDGACTDTLAWAEYYRSIAARRAVALTRRLRASGATCDCSVVTAVWRPSIALWSRDPVTGELAEPAELPRCRGVRPGSTQPCDLWVSAEDVAL